MSTASRKKSMCSRGELLDMRAEVEVLGETVFETSILPTPVAAPGVQLPRMPIPKFSGAFAE